MSKAVEDILRDALKLGQDIAKTENLFTHGESDAVITNRMCIEASRQNDLFISLCACIAEKGTI